METNENYNRQHQDIRIENNVKYGDVIDGVDFEYVKNLTSVNAINLALLASSPPPPQNLKIGGIVEPSVKFKWDYSENQDIIGYKIYWRTTSAPNWEFSKVINKKRNFMISPCRFDDHCREMSGSQRKNHL